MFWYTRYNLEYLTMDKPSDNSNSSFDVGTIILSSLFLYCYLFLFDFFKSNLCNNLRNFCGKFVYCFPCLWISFPCLYLDNNWLILFFFVCWAKNWLFCVKIKFMLQVVVQMFRRIKINSFWFCFYYKFFVFNDHTLFL